MDLINYLLRPKPLLLGSINEALYQVDIEPTHKKALGSV